jgi:hypothetical protein
MDNDRDFIATQCRAGIPLLLVGLALFCVTPAEAQLAPRLSAAYAKAARLSLAVIELDSSAPQDDDSEAIEIDITRTIDAAAEKAVTNEEKSMTEMLRQIYQSKRHDNSTLRAYQVLMDVENASDPSDDLRIRKQKDYAVSQFADGQAEIMKHEEPCFRQLEQLLDHRTLREASSCSEWIQKTMKPVKSNIR